jgi:hypothetical protein
MNPYLLGYGISVVGAIPVTLLAWWGLHKSVERHKLATYRAAERTAWLPFTKRLVERAIYTTLIGFSVSGAASGISVLFGIRGGVILASEKTAEESRVAVPGKGDQKGQGQIAASTISQSVIYLGRFSNMEFTEEHQYGSEIELWKSGIDLLGHFFNSEGLAGDTPRALTENVKYNAETGDLSFEARLRMGVVSWSGKGKDYREVWSRELFIFKGKVLPESVVGILEVRDGWKPDLPLKQKPEKVELKRIEGPKESRNFNSRSAWEAHSQSYVKRRNAAWE